MSLSQRHYRSYNSIYNKMMPHWIQSGVKPPQRLQRELPYGHYLKKAVYPLIAGRYAYNLAQWTYNRAKAYYNRNTPYTLPFSPIQRTANYLPYGNYIKTNQFNKYYAKKNLSKKASSKTYKKNYKRKVNW